MKSIFSGEYKLGVLGGGQLGKMLIQAASKWNIRVDVLDPNPECPARNICHQFTEGRFSDYETVLNFGKGLDMITVEIEHVNTEALIALKKKGVEVHPDPEKLQLIQDKGKQKEFYDQHNIATSPYRLFPDKEAVLKAVESRQVQLPFVQKSRTAGYDGKGVAVISNEEALQNLLEGPAVVENKVDIEKEIAVIVARNSDGDIRCFPPVEMSFNAANLVDYLFCPALISEEVARKAVELAEQTIRAFEVSGILAVELFLDKKGNLMVNEVAPRPHNSGHQTIEGNYVSQYEQHLRAILNLPLGSTRLKASSLMLNLLGEKGHQGTVVYEGMEECLSTEGVNVHLYGKKETRPNRKMGHVTIIAEDLDSARKKAKFVKETLKVIS